MATYKQRTKRFSTSCPYHSPHMTKCELHKTCDFRKRHASRTPHTRHDTFLGGYGLPSFKCSSPIWTTSVYRPTATSTNLPLSHHIRTSRLRNRTRIFGPCARCGVCCTIPHDLVSQPVPRYTLIADFRHFPLLVLSRSLSSSCAVKVTFISLCCQGHFPLLVMSRSLSSPFAVKVTFLSLCCQGYFPLLVLSMSLSSPCSVKVTFLSLWCQGHFPLLVLSRSLSSPYAAKVTILSLFCQGHFPLLVLSRSLSSPCAAKVTFLSLCCQGHFPFLVLPKSLSSPCAVKVTSLSFCCQSHFPLLMLSRSLSSPCAVKATSLSFCYQSHFPLLVLSRSLSSPCAVKGRKQLYSRPSLSEAYWCMSVSMTVRQIPTLTLPLVARYSFDLDRCKKSRNSCSVRSRFCWVRKKISRANILSTVRRRIGGHNFNWGCVNHSSGIRSGTIRSMWAIPLSVQCHLLRPSPRLLRRCLIVSMSSVSAGIGGWSVYPVQTFVRRDYVMHHSVPDHSSRLQQRRVPHVLPHSFPINLRPLPCKTHLRDLRHHVVYALLICL